MRTRLLTVLMLLGVWPSAAFAVEVQDFQMETTQDLLDVCAVDASDPLVTEAIHFCHGFFVGALQYHQSVVGPDMKPLICAPEGVTRNEVIQAFIYWGRAHKDDAALMGELPVVGAVRAAEDRWPCQR
jgi:hypothetical protein